MLKRILEKQLELNEYETFGGGVHWDPANTNSKENKEKIVRKMTFLQEVQTLSDNYIPEKLKELKTRIRSIAQSSGRREATFTTNLYDSATIKALREEGFEVRETMDQRDGDFITVKW